MGEVDWILHSKVVSKHSSNKITKYMHRCLPVQQTMHRRFQASSPICRRCGQEEEDDDHVLKCSEAKKWRDELYASYEAMAILNKQDLECIKYINQALEKWVNGEIFDVTTVPSKYHASFLSQNRIGWANWFRGRISKEFRSLLPQRDKKKGFLFLVINKTIDEWCILWKLRNDTVHGATSTARTTEKRNRIHAELEHIYARRDQYLEKDKDILLESVEEHKTLSLSSIQNWMLLYKHQLIESAKISKKMALKGVHLITNYFSFT